MLWILKKERRQFFGNGILRVISLISICVLTAPVAQAGSDIHFRNVAERAGIEFAVDNSETVEKYQIEPMIAGVAVFDYDNDGLLDIYVCNGAEIPVLTKSGPKYFNRLYRNLGQLRFSDVTQIAGVAGAGYSMGVSVGDYNNDGWADLYVTGVNQNILYENQGDGTFSDVTDRASVSAYLKDSGKAWSVAAGWFDYDLDGDLDLFVVNYCVWSIERDLHCGAREPGQRTYCHPRHFDPLPNILYRNEGDGTFTDVSEVSGIGRHLGKGMGIAFADFDLDGFPDVFISNDAWRNFLFRNLGSGRFEEIALMAGVSYVDSGRPVSGMGADAGDYDGDGLFDIFMTALSNETFPLFRNLGNGLFRDERFPSGLGLESLPWGGWSVGMVDFDNDGFLDFFTAGGHVQTNEEAYSGRSSAQPNRVFRNLGNGNFQDVTSLCGDDFQQLGLHRGAAFGDLDNDGLMDAVVTRLNENLEIFHNETPDPGHFLILELKGTSANRDGLGATARLTLASGREFVRHSRTAVGYGSSSDKRIHFGLGKVPEVKELEVIWPGGKRQLLNDFPLDRVVSVNEPK